MNPFHGSLTFIFTNLKPCDKVLPISKYNHMKLPFLLLANLRQTFSVSVKVPKSMKYFVASWNISSLK